MTHHAYYIEDSAAAYEAYKSALKPFYARQYERFGIDEARELSSLAALKNYADSIFLLGVAAITSEAQQALLKLFEEPQQRTRFVLLVPHGILLPTLKSRMLEYPSKLAPDSPVRTEAKKFLTLPGKERGDRIATLLKDGERERVRDFLNALEIELAKKIKEPNVREALGDIAMARDYLRDRSPSLKMLLEHLAMSLPTP